MNISQDELVGLTELLSRVAMLTGERLWVQGLINRLSEEVEAQGEEPSRNGRDALRAEVVQQS